MSKDSKKWSNNDGEKAERRVSESNNISDCLSASDAVVSSDNDDVVGQSDTITASTDGSKKYRDQYGRFIKGSKGGPGRPKKRQPLTEARKRLAKKKRKKSTSEPKTLTEGDILEGFRELIGELGVAKFAELLLQQSPASAVRLISTLYDKENTRLSNEPVRIIFSSEAPPLPSDPAAQKSDLETTSPAESDTASENFDDDFSEKATDSEGGEHPATWTCRVCEAKFGTKREHDFSLAVCPICGAARPDLPAAEGKRPPARSAAHLIELNDTEPGWKTHKTLQDALNDLHDRSQSR